MSETETQATGETGKTPSKRKRRRILSGIVRSDKMQKTVVVEVTRRVLHATYKKYVTRRVRYKAHDEHGSCHTGDIVQIVEVKPLSRDKRWRVLRLLEQAK
jgi:small subunit ribosomal protein S17